MKFRKHYIGIMVIFFSLFFTFRYMGLPTNKETEISAHPNSIIKLDEGTAEEFEVPVDATKKYEPISGYTTYVQNEKKSVDMSLSDVYVNQYASNFVYSSGVIELSNGNRIMNFTQRNDASLGTQPLLFRTGVCLQDSDGRIIKSVDVLTNSILNGNSLISPPRAEIALALIDNGNDTYSYGYSIISSSGVKTYRRVIDQDLNQVVPDVEIALAIKASYGLSQTRLSTLGGGELFQVGAYMPGSAAVIQQNQISQFPIYEYSITNNLSAHIIDLKLPKWTDVNQVDSLASLTGKNAVAITVTGIGRFSSGEYIANVTYGTADSNDSIIGDRAVIVFDKLGNAKSIIKANTRNAINIQRSSTVTQAVLQIQETDGTEIVGIDANAVKKILISKDRLPANTNIMILPNKDTTNKTEYDFYGTTTLTNGDFSRLIDSGVVLGSYDKDYELSNVQKIGGFSVDTPFSFESVQKKNNHTNLMFTGSSSNYGLIDFVAPPGGWSKFTAKNNVFGVSGTIYKSEDYAPLINKGTGIKVDIEDAKVTQPTSSGLYNWSSLDRWLITGSKNGGLSDASSVKVFDTITVAKPSFGQQWLERQININPKNRSVAIDWKKLGFDNSQCGPQLVTYFVSDSQNLTSSTSRWVNAVDGNTSHDSKETVFLRGENFAINKNDVSGLTEQKVKEHAKTQAWLGDPASVGSPFTEDMTANPVKQSAKVTLKTPAQLTVIKTATTHAKAKPYPLDINYQDTVEGVTKKVTHRLWVFVTNDNTTVDNGVVLYADDFKVPLKQVTSATADSVLKKPKYKQTQPGVLVYDYVSQPQTDQSLTPISKGKPDGESKGLSVASSSMAQLTGVTGSTTIPQFDFTFTNPVDSKVTTVRVTATVDEEKEFCFKLERTNDKLIIVEPVIDATVSGNYQSIEVTVPIHVTLDTPVTLPTGWQSFPAVTTATTRTYQYNMKGKNAKAQVIDFLEALKLTIGTPVDKPGEVLITLREDELLANTPPKPKMATQALRASQVITTRDFRLEAESKWDDVAEVNYVDLEWEKIPNLSQAGYKLFQSEDGVVWNNRSLNYAKVIKVLNVYPDIAGSNTLKGWMDGLALKDGGGNNLIQVTPVSWTNYNANSAGYLKNGAGDYIYDVIMFGSWDSNNGKELNPAAIAETLKFVQSGRGTLWGHDTLIGQYANSIKAFGPYIGLGYLQVQPEAHGNPNASTWVGSDDVRIKNNGYLMKYPYELANNAKFTIPYAHNIELQNINVGTTWLEFGVPNGGWPNPIKNFLGKDGKTYRNGWYLKTNGNVGMIQTGHSSGASTVDERKIIANTLYNLAQVSFDNHGVDYTVKDDVPPVITTMTRNASNQVTIDGKDTGKTYQFYVTADTKDKGQLKSDVVEEEVVSDMKGYVYVIDANPTTLPTVTKDAFGKVTNINAPVVNPEVSRQATFAGFTSQNQWLHVVPVDRAHNVGAVKHIQLKDIPYTEPPGSINCTGVIPQKVYIKGKDDQGQSLTAGDQVLQTALRIGKQLSFTPTTIPWYDYVELRELDSTVITPEVVTVEGTKQDVEAIYTRSLAHLHLRQVVLSPHAALVEPIRGEGTVLNTTTLGGTIQARLPVTYPTQLDALAGFKTLTYEVNTADPFYQLEAILPEYYAYDGYVLTTSNTAHSAALKVTGQPTWTITSAPEVWVTLYLKPTQSPGFYGWQYGNDSGYTVSP